MILTVEDILNGMADRIGVYGAHDEERDFAPGESCPCRVCFLSGVRDQLEQAFRIERILEAGLAAETKGETK
jgi:hypothetical protein